MRNKLLNIAREHCRPLAVFGPVTDEKAIIIFANFLEVSEGGLKKWIYGSRRPRYATMKRIAGLTQGRMSLEDW